MWLSIKTICIYFRNAACNIISTIWWKRKICQNHGKENMSKSKCQQNVANFYNKNHSKAFNFMNKCSKGQDGSFRYVWWSINHKLHEENNSKRSYCVKAYLTISPGTPFSSLKCQLWLWGDARGAYIAHALKYVSFQHSTLLYSIKYSIPAI